MKSVEHAEGSLEYSEQFSISDILTHFNSEGFESFLHAFYELYNHDRERVQWLNAVFRKRNENIFTTVQHFSWLLPRCYIFLLAKKNMSIMSQVGLVTKDEWKLLISDIHHEHIEELEQLLLHRIVATFVPNRYAAMGAAISLLRTSNTISPTKYVDLGCSANLGVGTVFQDVFEPEIIDKSRLWNTDFRSTMPNTIVGVDIQQPDLLWTACSSWPRYVAEAYELLVERQELINKSPFSVDFLHANITDTEKIGALLGTQVADVVHASLVQYFLPQEGRDKVTNLAESILVDDGIMVETDMFKFGENFNTPLSVETRLRVKRNGRLSNPITIMRHARYESFQQGPSDSCKVWIPDFEGIHQLKHNLLTFKEN